MPPAIKQAAASAAPKVTNVYRDEAEGLADILGAAAADTPAPSPEAVRQVEAIHAGAVVPGARGGGAGLDGGGGIAGVDGAGGGAVAVDPLKARESAEGLFDLFVSAGRFIGAEEWEPESAEEREHVVRAAERVFLKRGAPPLPPELGLLLAVGRYSQRRMTKPKTAVKLAGWLARLPLPGFVLRFAGVEPAEPPPPKMLRDELPGDRPAQV